MTLLLEGACTHSVNHPFGARGEEEREARSLGEVGEMQDAS